MKSMQDKRSSDFSLAFVYMKNTELYMSGVAGDMGAELDSDMVERLFLATFHKNDSFFLIELLEESELTILTLNFSGNWYLPLLIMISLTTSPT